MTEGASKESVTLPLEYAEVPRVSKSRTSIAFTACGGLTGFVGLVTLWTPFGGRGSIVLIVTGMCLYVSGVIVQLTRRRDEPEE